MYAGILHMITFMGSALVILILVGASVFVIARREEQKGRTPDRAGAYPIPALSLAALAVVAAALFSLIGR